MTQSEPNGSIPFPTITPITALIVLDTMGDRIIAKYYPEAFEEAGCNDKFTTYKEQREFEKKLFSMTNNVPDNEVALIDNLIIIYKPNLDLLFYIIGGMYENELMLQSILDCFFNSLQELLKPQLDRKAMLKNWDLVACALDEIIESGIPIESEPKEIVQKLSKPSLSLNDIQINEQTIKSAFNFAKDHMKSLLNK